MKKSEAPGVSPSRLHNRWSKFPAVLHRIELIADTRVGEQLRPSRWRRAAGRGWSEAIIQRRIEIRPRARWDRKAIAADASDAGKACTITGRRFAGRDHAGQRRGNGNLVVQPPWREVYCEVGMRMLDRLLIDVFIGQGDIATVPGAAI